MTEICFVLKHQLPVSIHLCFHYCHTVKPVLSSTVLGRFLKAIQMMWFCLVIAYTFQFFYPFLIKY